MCFGSPQSAPAAPPVTAPDFYDDEITQADGAKRTVKKLRTSSPLYSSMVGGSPLFAAWEGNDSSNSVGPADGGSGSAAP